MGRNSLVYCTKKMIVWLKTFCSRCLKFGKRCLLKVLLLFGVSLLFFPGTEWSTASATSQPGVEKTQEAAKKEQLISWNNFLQVVSSFAYVLLWPLVALAGLAMDNQLIYGSFMHLDTSLWNMWQIVRTFANYALGLIFLIGILLYNLSPERKI